MTTINLPGIKYKDIEKFAIDYANTYFFGLPICPIFFVGEDDKKKMHFYNTFRFTIKQLIH